MKNRPFTLVVTVFVDLLNSRGAQFGNQLASRFLSGGLRLNLECTPAADGYTRAVCTSKLLTSVRKHMRTLPPASFLSFTTLRFQPTGDVVDGGRSFQGGLWWSSSNHPPKQLFPIAPFSPPHHSGWILPATTSSTPPYPSLGSW